jgi:phage-related protein
MIRFSDPHYVLHAFQKKSPSSIATRLYDVALIRERLKAARQDYEERNG